MNAGFLDSVTGDEGEVDVGLTPLIDVVFQLLVFFMLTSTFAAPALELVLPEIEAPTESAEQTGLLVEIDADGKVMVNGEAAGNDLPAFIRTETEGEKEIPPASIRADRATAYERVTQVMHALSQSGIQQINFVYELPENQ